MMYGSENNPISPSAREKIKNVVARHEGMRIDRGWSRLDAEERQAIILDLEWCYCFNPLDLDAMLSCEADVLFADIAGIVAQLDRLSGFLPGFQPQCLVKNSFVEYEVGVVYRYVVKLRNNQDPESDEVKQMVLLESDEGYFDKNIRCGGYIDCSIEEAQKKYERRDCCDGYLDLSESDIGQI